MQIAGAGLAGLIAANMLRNQVTCITDVQSAIPNNHSALLRFKSSVVGDAVNIPFRKVRVIKAVQPWRNAVADALAYSVKCTGTVNLRSSITANGEIEERFIAPLDFISQLAEGAGKTKFAFNHNIVKPVFHEQPLISTIPMPSLMRVLGWEPISEFRSVEGYTVVADLPEEFGVDVCATVYLPDPAVPAYRASITDSRLIIEVAGEGCKIVPLTEAASSSSLLKVVIEPLRALGVLGHVPSQLVLDSAVVRPMKYAKILPIDEAERKAFIMHASERFNIYSLGRFATWRPKLLLDDLVNDIRVIQRMATGDSSHRYASRKE